LSKPILFCWQESQRLVDLGRGWLVYNRRLGGVLPIDFTTHVVSFVLLRRAEGPPRRAASGKLRADIVAAEIAGALLARTLEGLTPFCETTRGSARYELAALGAIAGVVVTPSLSDRVFHAEQPAMAGKAGASGILEVLCMRRAIARLGWRMSMRYRWPLASGTMLSLFAILPIAVLLTAPGSARGVSGVAMNTSLMEQVPKHFMGRVQNTFYFVGTFLQITLGVVVGAVAQKFSLAGGFAIIGSVYVFAFISAVWPVDTENSVVSTLWGDLPKGQPLSIFTNLRGLCNLAVKRFDFPPIKARAGSPLRRLPLLYPFNSRARHVLSPRRPGAVVFEL
jgi:hypothetical protein